MRRVVVTAAIAGAALLPARPAAACSCAFSSTTEAVRNAEVIFTGTAIDSQGDTQLGPAQTTFAVETAYKGNVPSEVVVKHEVQGSACGLLFDRGERYTVFGYRTTGEIETNSCWPTAAGDIDSAALGLEASPVAQGERSRVDVDEVWPFWVTLSGLVLAIGTLSLWDTRRRRRGPRG